MAAHHQLAQSLVDVCNSGDARSLVALLDQNPGIDLNFTTEGGVTLLMHAIIGAGTGINPNGQYLEMCRLLVQSGVLLETADVTYGRTATHWAVYYHMADILVELIISGGDVTIPDFSGVSPFHLAIEESATRCISEALRFLPKEIHQYPDPQGRSPIVHAIQLKNLDICQVLLPTMPSVNEVDPTSGRTPLHFAAEMANGPITELLLRSGCILDHPDLSGLTPIHIAAIVESQEPLSAILRVVGGEVLDLPDARGLTPLMHACLYGNEGNLKFLMKKKANISLQDAEGKTCLHWAAESAYPSAPNCVQLISKKHKELLEARDSYQRTPLHSCAMSGTVETLQVLISCECDVAAVDGEQHNAVHWATVSGNPTMLAALIDIGCQFASPDARGNYPLHYAAQHSREPPPDLYVEEAVLLAQNVQECLRILVEKGAPVDSVDSQNMQPLHWALQFQNNLKACALLMSHGADPNAKDSEGLTGLHISAHQGLTENCQFLLEHTSGSHANEQDSQGRTALFHAVESGNIECVEYLLNVGFSPDHLDSENRSSAHIAASLGYLPCLQILHAYRADINSKSIHGATPMHEAAANGHSDALEYLISVGCQVNEPAGPTGVTALHYAASGRSEGCIGVLLHYGADINSITTTEEGERLTPLDYCTETPDLAELLKAHGALPGSELLPERAEDDQPEPEAAAADVRTEEDESPAIHEETAGEEELVLKEPVRPVSPSKQSLERVVFELEETPEASDHMISARRPSMKSLEITEVPADEGEPRKPPAQLKRSDARMQLFGEKEGIRQQGRPEAPRRQQSLLDKALSALKRSKPPPTDSILSSSVGFYAAHATMLAAAIIGTPMGEKAMEIAEKVATDTAEELKRAAVEYEGELPDLVWLQDEVETPPTPVVVERPPTPTPTPPPPPEIKEDPYERRMRKAKAQMDMRKTPAYRAVEELLKAQNTHMTLKRQFEEAKLAEDITEMKQAFEVEEQLARETSNQTMRKFNERIRKAETVSEQVNKTIDTQLQEARRGNSNTSTVMGRLGVSPRPTVAQWLQQKTEQKKAAMQDALIDWDRNKQHREAAILLQQTITSQRAMKHAAWGARKDISAKLKALKEGSDARNETALLRQRQTFPSPPRLRKTVSMATGKLKKRGALPPMKAAVTKTPPKPSKFQTTISTSPSSHSSVRATPQGFLKVRDTMLPGRETSPGGKQTPGRRTMTGSPAGTEQIWQLGESYVQGKYRRPPTEAFLRATGPKDVHAERTLHFLPPKEYKRPRRRQEMSGGIASHQPKSRLTINSLEFESKTTKTRERSSSSAQYHSLADSIGGQLPRKHKRQKSVEIPVLPMKVLDRNSLPPAVVS